MATDILVDGYAQKDTKHVMLCYCMHFECFVINQILPFLCWYFSCPLKMNMNSAVVFCYQKVSVSILYDCLFVYFCSLPYTSQDILLQNSTAITSLRV